MIVAAGLIAMLLLLLFGMPVAFALGIAGILGLYLKGGLDMVLGVLNTAPISGTSSYELITVPMFMLMAEFIIVSRIAEELFDSAKVKSEEHTSELQSLMRISYAVFCLKKKKTHCTYLLHTASRTAH